MLKRALAVLVALGALTITTPARAADFTGQLAGWMMREQAVARVPGPSGDIVISTQHCPGSDAWACADIDGGVLYLAVRSRFAAYHEIGHFFDARDLTDDDRLSLKLTMHVNPLTPWAPPGRTADRCGEDQCPNEMFADAYADCALGNTPAVRHHRAHWATAYGYSPTVAEHRDVCGLIRAAAP